ncbi:response regulator [Polyangium aurulentum]|uniref:response regulator n=1 Tax=Polyangium aurulentum TaxID=2567896 RepID=UPI0010AE3AFD|nr:response regulator [Polyangium aurulentum]UQA62920.1 response regulator [Polyangium aurulentum]
MSDSERAPASTTLLAGLTGVEERRRVIAHLRHELRTCLTAVIGYSEDLLETLKDPPEEVEGNLRALMNAGNAVLGSINELLGAEAIRDLTSEDLPPLVRKLGETCKAPAGTIEPLCVGLIAAAERANLYTIIPTLCRIQASGVMLMELLDGYALEESPRVLRGGIQIDLGASRGEVAEVAYQRGRLLIVDDNSVSRDVLRQWLARQGYDVDEASGGDAALEMIRGNEYDLILLDIIMPDKTGVEVLDVLHAEGRLGRAPVIMISAFDEFDGVVHCIERGADDFVSKPFNTVLLGTRIRNYLELKRHRDRERAYQATLREIRDAR